MTCCVGCLFSPLKRLSTVCGVAFLILCSIPQIGLIGGAGFVALLLAIGSVFVGRRFRKAPDPGDYPGHTNTEANWGHMSGGRVQPRKGVLTTVQPMQHAVRSPAMTNSPAVTSQGGNAGIRQVGKKVSGRAKRIAQITGNPEPGETPSPEIRASQIGVRVNTRQTLTSTPGRSWII